MLPLKMEGNFIVFTHYGSCLESNPEFVMKQLLSQQDKLLMIQIRCCYNSAHSTVWTGLEYYLGSPLILNSSSFNESVTI